MSKVTLSDHDRAVMESIFDPTQSGGQIPYAKQEELQDLNDDEGEVTTAVQQSRKIEIEAISAAENGELERATDMLEIAIQLAPHRAAPFNNRAQIYRIQGDNDAAMLDLEQALKLSKSAGRTGCRALCQRGLLRRKANDIEGARADFEKATKMGSQFARSQLVELNPYSAMCNQMLREVMDKIN